MELRHNIASRPKYSDETSLGVVAIMLYDETGSGKSNMAAFKQEVHISQLVDVIKTKF